MLVRLGGRKMEMRSVWFDGDGLRLIDQRLLPFEFKIVECGTAEHVARAIRNMTVRGAPAIGVAAAYGFVLGLRGLRGRKGGFRAGARRVLKLLNKSRPTAVNLRNSLSRVMSACTHSRNEYECK